MTCRLMSLITQGIPEKYTQFCCVSVSPTPSPISLYDLQNKSRALVGHEKRLNRSGFANVGLQWCQGRSISLRCRHLVGEDIWERLCKKRVLDLRYVASHGPIQTMGKGNKTRRNSPPKNKPPWTVVMNGGRCFTDGLQRREWPAEKVARLPQGKGWVRGGQNTSVTEVVFL